MSKYIVHNFLRVATDFVPETFGRLTTLGPAFMLGRSAFQVCECSCGTVKTVQRERLLDGSTKSCKCMQKELIAARSTTHGHSRTMEYKTWVGIRFRCNNSKSDAYPDYGGRGIRVCPEWDHSHGYPQFLADMGPRPPECDSIERKDVNGNYCPENCKWADTKEQNRNRRNTRRLTIFGKTLLLLEWAELVGMSHISLAKRLRIGWTPEKAVTYPIRRPGGRYEKLDTSALPPDASRYIEEQGEW